MAGTSRNVDQTYKVPAFPQSMKFLEKALANKKKYEEAQARAERARAAAEEEDSGDEEEERRHEALVQGLQQAAEQMQLAVNLEGLREVEAVLAPLPPPQLSEQDDVDLDASYLGALTAARSALGLDDVLPELAASREDRLELFASGLRSGYVRATALQHGAAPAPLVQALLSTMTQSPDTETAGAAFVTLMALMGDEEAAKLGGSGAAANALLAVDSHFGLPAPAAGQALPACKLGCFPTDGQLMEALRADGYSPQPGGAGGRQQTAQQRQQLGAAPAADGQQQGEEGEGQQGPPQMQRIQTVKLILRTAAAVCRYCAKHPAAAAGALSREGLSDLLLAAVHLGLDPAANQLREEITEATAALLGAFDEVDWERKLPQLADRLAEMGPSHHSRYRLLCNLPTAAPRGLALQQFAGAVLLERLLPDGHKLAPSKSAINRRAATALDPAAVIAAQPWFSNGKGLVAGATSGVAVVPAGGYSIGTVELLLRLCHLLLWPHVLAYVAGEASAVSPPVLQRWHDFLGAVQKNVRSMQPEDQNVKMLATVYDVEYKNVAEGLEPMAV
ncbi:FAM178A-like isoform X2 [Chlorella sorokiniana]|uniref:FAM178A-like isoform X2 n=1 Tax=Chlorella sorokiniana TaxID=3076 RepID=A0A2P6U356_CHLSO|nr:FAM178A-like isoform X2 [Chlorella sorokiniana]|eukprot:PRW60750.1 FAM178A-like isoform X2 [Chlorella sorokiniana]